MKLSGDLVDCVVHRKRETNRCVGLNTGISLSNTCVRGRLLTKLFAPVYIYLRWGLVPVLTSLLVGMPSKLTIRGTIV